MFNKTHVNLIVTIVILLFAPVVTRAQVFGLGDPIINVTFGADNLVHGPEIPGFVGGDVPYTFTNANVPPTGSYTLLNNTNVASNIWWPTLDHTPGDGDNGYMLIVKTRTSGYQVLYQRTISGLCAGTEYEFLAYVANISRNAGGVPPKLRLRVQTNSTPRVDVRPNGDELINPINYNASGQVSVDWIPIITSFTPNASGSVIVSIISESAGGPSADDLAIDDITIKARGQKIDANFTTINGDFYSACQDTQEEITATGTAPLAGNQIRWQHKLDNGKWEFISDPASSPDFTIKTSTTPGTHRYRTFSATPANINSFECAVVSNELTVLVKPIVTVDAGPNKFYLRGNPPVLLEGSSNSTNLTWEAVSGADVSSLSSTTIATPLASPDQTTIYKLTANTDNNTCGPQPPPRFVTVTVADDITLPNTFTPNSDGINDKWIIGGIDSYPNPAVRVFNRNGQLIFRSVGIGTSAWDGTYNGKNVPAGTYYYIVDLNINGLKLSGSVTVLR